VAARQQAADLEAVNAEREKQLRRARTLRSQGHAYHSIGRQLGVSRMTAHRLVNGRPDPIPGRKPGRPRHPDDTVEVKQLRAAGMSYRSIARQLGERITALEHEIAK
jgi:transposase